MSQVARKYGRYDKPFVGATLAFVAMSLFSVQDVIVKWLSSDYPLFQLLFIRSIVVVSILLVILFWRSGTNAFRTQRKGDHLLRSAINFAAFLSYYFAVSRMPLADVTAIALSAPLFMTALSGPLLGEPADLPRKMALVAGFLGVLIIVQPTAENIDTIGVAAALFGALLFALLGIQTRRMSTTESSGLMVFSSALVIFVMAGGVSLFSWVTPDLHSMALMIGLGVVSLAAQFCIVQAYRFTQVYVVAPFDYVTILWAILFGWMFFAHLPTPTMLFGASIVVACGLYIVMRKK
ncbi:MAG: DMT family transporter [Arenicellales bacterium WSBS_2016_MAG_OTU3]